MKRSEALSHQHHQERELFRTIEAVLPDDELEQLGAAFARAEAGKW